MFYTRPRAGYGASMADWTLLGPKIPVPVWRKQLLRAVGFDDGAIVWAPMRGSWDDLDADRLPSDARTLLLLHGTGMITRPGFHGFTEGEFDELWRRYEGRILAFEHQALQRALPTNARALSGSLLAGGVRLHLDILGLSRGGLLGRYLAEGWAEAMLSDRVTIDKLVFLGTPNGGTPSARRDPLGAGAREMKAWRTDVRRVALIGDPDREVEEVEDPFTLDRYEPADRYLTWPMFRGTIDQLPGSTMLRKLNGFAGPAPGQRWRDRPPRYYGIAAVFTFDHGAPDPVLVGGQKPLRRSEVARWALPVPNDLVVPTRSVYAPLQGPDASGLFPLIRERLLVLAPTANATHTGLMRLGAVRRRIVSWLLG